MKKLALGLCVSLTFAALLVGQRTQDAPAGSAMQKAAVAFLESLDDSQRATASFKFNDAERLNWHFIPRERKGIPLRQLEGEALKTAQDLIASGLSSAGYDQALKVMSLEEVLYLLEGGDRETRRARRDPLKYHISVFGKPQKTGIWGWRVEGHHLSLNYTIEDGVLVSSTPEFFGANPGSMDSGPGRTLRVLGPEEDIARQILKACSPSQQRQAWIDKTAPKDIRDAGVAQPDQAAPVGLEAANMSADQKKLLGELLGEYLKNMPAEVSRQRRAQIESSGMDKVHFAWWGGSELNEPHYYRVQGPTFLIEYNNTQNSANHVHSIWRNMSGDFNAEL